MSQLELRLQQAGASLDSALVQRCIDGNEQAWQQLVHRYQRLIYSIAMRMMRDPEAAADVMQQVFLQLYQQLDEIRQVASLPAWLATVTRRRVYDYFRSTRVTEPLRDDEHVDSDDAFSRIHNRHTLETALAGLPDRHRRLIEMLYMSPKPHSYEEIARELAMPVSSVGPTRLRSLNKLRKLLS